MKQVIENLKYYPQDSNHQKCTLYDVSSNELPFQITKGKDAYWYADEKGEEHFYGNKSGVPDKRWIVHLKDFANPSLRTIFKIKTSRSLETLVKYCRKLYLRSIDMEIRRLQEIKSKETLASGGFKVKDLEKKLNKYISPEEATEIFKNW